MMQYDQKRKLLEDENDNRGSNALTVVPCASNKMELLEKKSGSNF